MLHGHLDCSIQANTGRWNTELNMFKISVSSDVPTYKRCKKKQIDTYIYYFSCKIIRRNCSAVGWVPRKKFQVDVSVKRLHVIHMTLKDCIGFRKRNIHLVISQIRSVQYRHPICELISTVHNQQKGTVFTNK